MVTSATPLTFSAAAATSSSNPLFAITIAGDVAPAGNASARTSWPTAASGATRNCSVEESPTFTPVAPKLRIAKITKPAIETITGRLLTPRPSFAQRPFSDLFTPPNFGTNGQNKPRPKTTIAAGKTTKAANIAITIPPATTKPRVLFPPSCAKSKVSRARATVPPEAKTAGVTPLSALFIAWWRSSFSSNSSR